MVVPSYVRVLIISLNYCCYLNVLWRPKCSRFRPCPFPSTLLSLYLLILNALPCFPWNLNPLHWVVTLAWVIIKFLHGLITLVAKLQLLNFKCLFFYSIAERHRNKISEVTFDTLFRVDQLKVFYSSYSKKSFDFCVLTSCASISICLSLLQKDTFMRIYPRLREVAQWLRPRPKSGWLLRSEVSLLFNALIIFVIWLLFIFVQRRVPN